jgi:hypothetical protein
MTENVTRYVPSSAFCGLPHTHYGRSKVSGMLNYTPTLTVSLATPLTMPSM